MIKEVATIFYEFFVNIVNTSPNTNPRILTIKKFAINSDCSFSFNMIQRKKLLE